MILIEVSLPGQNSPGNKKNLSYVKDRVLTCGTTLFDPADVWPAVPTLRPLSRGSRLPYWSFAATGRAPVEVAARE